MLAADELSAHGIDVRLLNFSSLKPLDTEMLLQAAEETRAIVVCEEHSVIGGLYSAVAEVLAGTRPTIVEPVAVMDTFCETGPDPETLMDACGLGVEEIILAVRRAVGRKR